MVCRAPAWGDVRRPGILARRQGWGGRKWGSSPVNGPEHSLLERVAGGDADALAALLERHGPAVRRALAGAIPARWQSLLTLDDVMQEVYAEAFGGVRGFTARDGHSFEDWLVVIARRTLLDGLRGLAAEKRGGDRARVAASAGGDDSYISLLEVLGVTTTTPSRAAARHEGASAVRGAIERLPEAQRVVVERCDLQGRNAEEVAAELGRSVGAVYMLRARAHRALCEIMGAPLAYLSGKG